MKISNYKWWIENFKMNREIRVICRISTFFSFSFLRNESDIESMNLFCLVMYCTCLFFFVWLYDLSHFYKCLGSILFILSAINLLDLYKSSSFHIFTMRITFCVTFEWNCLWKDTIFVFGYGKILEMGLNMWCFKRRIAWPKSFG